MFFLDDRTLVTSPSDLRLAATCEFALVRALDVLSGRASAAAAASDAMLARVSQLGDQHEQRELLRLSAQHPGRVVQFPRPAYTREALTAAHEQTLAALRSDAEVVVQATFFDGGFVGHADFLERTDDGWLVSDAKLARSDSVPALLQIAAYAACLRDAGIPTAPVARLLLGSGLASDHALDDLLPVYRARRQRMDDLLADHQAGTDPGGWGDPRWLACGRCDECGAQVEEARDLLLVAGMRMPTRRRLLEAGVSTIEQLAERVEPVPSVRESTLERLRAQAALQLRQDTDPDGTVVADVISAEALARMPAPSPGDVFFDFEGDPLWAEPGSRDWGLEYLFGMVEVDTGQPQFRTFWAHDRAQEKQALVDFVAHLTRRREQWPDLHVYHYAAYEKTALLRLAVRHGVCEEEIDQFLRDGVFVDLYAVVRAGVRVSQRSYSIKKLEPLYMEARDVDLQSGGDSIVVYHEYCEARDLGDRAVAEARLQEIHDYNRDDCLSTLGLRDWLLRQLPDGLTAEAQEVPEPRPVSAERQDALELEADLRALVGDVPVGDRTPEQEAAALVAASVLFHAREDKPYYWEHYDRVAHPVGNWQRAKGVAVVDGDAEVVQPWHKPAGSRTSKRVYSVLVDPVDGSPLDPGSVRALYAAPPQFTPAKDHHERNAHAVGTGSVEILDTVEVIAGNGRTHQRLTILENAPGGSLIDDFPVAFVPGNPPSTKPIDTALRRLAEQVRDGWPALPQQAGIDVLLRRPRMRAGAGLPPVGQGSQRFVEAITAALTGMDSSFVAVQGPPGTGKTHVGAHVIAALVARGWRVGVCSQGHAAVENLLDGVIDAGVEPGQVGKCAKYASAPAWTALGHANELGGFIAEHVAAGRGFVVGGTAWDLTHPSRVEAGSLDLVVIDEAGQFSLAKTLAVSTAGARVLLLGDPAQLPQVSQGTHPEPVDESALGWLAGDAALLPPELGYFLETTWRMHPRLTEAVSALSYAGKLTSESAVTAARSVDGVEPGVHVVLVDHRERKTYAPEEAEAVVTLVSDLVGRTWTAPDETGPDSRGRPLGLADFCVITPYNNQVGTIKAALRDAGLGEVAVGTVDKFQGQQAPVAILSMAASSPGDVSRGIGFLLDRHRLNVAVSRGKHAAYLVRSPRLTDLAPRTPAELVALGAFIGLCDRAVTTEEVAGSALRDDLVPT